MEKYVECPSGLKGYIRPIKVSDEPLLKDPKLASSGKLIFELCSRCWVRTEDSGLYGFQGSPENWEKLLQGDTTWLFLQIRAATYGDHYEFPFGCKACGQVAQGEVYFSKITPQVPSDAALNWLTTGELIEEFAEDSGIKFKFRLMRGEDDIQMQHYKDTRNCGESRAAMLVRLQEVEGVTPGPHAIPRWADSLTSGQADEIISIMEDHECGVDTDIDVTCDKCGKEQTVVLPLGAAFFQRSPSKMTKKERRKNLRQKQLLTKDTE